MSQTDRATRNYLDSDRIVLHPNKITQGYVKFLQNGDKPVNYRVPTFNSEIPEEYSYGEKKLTKKVRSNAKFPKKLKRNVETLDAPSSQPNEYVAESEGEAQLQSYKQYRETALKNKVDTTSSGGITQSKEKRAKEVREALINPTKLESKPKPETPVMSESDSEKEENTAEEGSGVGAGAGAGPKTRVSTNKEILELVNKDLISFRNKTLQVDGKSIVDASLEKLKDAKEELEKARPKAGTSAKVRLTNLIAKLQEEINKKAPSVSVTEPSPSPSS